MSLWLSLLSAVVGLVTSFATYLREKGLLDAGAATAIVTSLQATQKAIADAKSIRAAVRRRAAGDPDSLRHDDGAKRP